MQRPFFLRHSSILLFALFIFVAILPACIVVVDEDDDDDDYYRRRWSLDVIVYGAVSESPGSSSNYSLDLSQENTLSGQADCTGFRGDYTTSTGNALQIESLSSSSSSCGRESLAGQYLDGLDDARSYTVSGDELTIAFGDEGHSMRFSPLE